MGRPGQPRLCARSPASCAHWLGPTNAPARPPPHPAPACSKGGSALADKADDPPFPVEDYSKEQLDYVVLTTVQRPEGGSVQVRGVGALPLKGCSP